MATTMPTWFTGALVNVRMARSASDVPRKSQMSPVAAASTASSRVTAGITPGVFTAR